MAAKRQQGATVQNVFGVLGRLAMFINPHAHRQRMVFTGRYLHVAVSDGAGGQIKHDWVSIGTRRGKGDGVGAKQRFLCAMRHHAGHAVDHAQRHQTFFGKRLNIGPQCCKVVRVAYGQHGNPGAAGFFNQ